MYILKKQKASIIWEKLFLRIILIKISKMSTLPFIRWCENESKENKRICVYLV